jgi:hypothetical protein
MPKTVWSLVGACAAVIGLCEPVPAHTDGARPRGERELDVHDWRVIDRESGPVNYYSVVEERSFSHIHAAYRPGLDTTVLGYELNGADHHARRLRWSWRAVALPREGNECLSRHGDSAAVVYISWKRGLKWYTLKYAWSATAPKGATCDKKRNAFVAQDTVVLESGGPTGTWVDEDIDLETEFRRAFENGDPNAEIPDLQGVAIMTDGDQTNSESTADYAKFVLVR